MGIGEGGWEKSKQINTEIMCCLSIVLCDNSHDCIATTDWTVRGSNPRGGEIFRTRPDRPWAHLASYTMGTGSFPRGKRAGRDFDHPPPSSAEVKERVELFGPLWPVLG